MLERITMQGIKLPRLYIAENREDAELAMEKGIPFVRWKQGKEKLIATLLMPTLRKMFPHIKWSKVANVPRSKSVMVNVPGNGRTDGIIDLDGDIHAGTSHHADGSWIPDLDDGEVYEESVVYSDGYRQISSDGQEIGSYKQVDLAVHIGDLSSQVNLDVLQELKLMPKFIGDIMDCIRTNVVAGTVWSEGWNKKKGAAIGNFDRIGELPNLIILDISASIPIGISSTMLMLIDTLRTQVHADLIITGGKSRFYPYGDELPTPQEIRNTIPRYNEAVEFNAIIRDHIAGKHYGHVISFGDYDSPIKFRDIEPTIATGTIIEHVHHYHTMVAQDTGYALWTNHLTKQPKKSYDTSWCKIIED